MFDLDRFTEDCHAAVREEPSHKAAREVLARANSDPTAVLAALGELIQVGVTTLYHSPELTILNVVWGKQMTIMPHNHLMWAVIGVYIGREDNIFWRRLPGEAGGLIEAAGAKSLGERCAVPLGPDIIHSVTNPLDRLTAAIHIYGGDFFAAARSEWNPETPLEGCYGLEYAPVRGSQPQIGRLVTGSSTNRGQSK